MADASEGGTDDISVSHDEVVLRHLFHKSTDGKPSPEDFILSSADKREEPSSLSVWATSRTTPDEAREFLLGPSRSKCTTYSLLPVGGIRAVRPDPDSPSVPYLDVIWVPLAADDQAGQSLRSDTATGHAGITGLESVHGLENAKLYAKSLRYQLSRLAVLKHY